MKNIKKLSLEDVENILRKYAKTNPAPHVAKHREKPEQSNLAPKPDFQKIWRKINVEVKRIKNAKPTCTATNDHSPSPNE